CKRRQAGRVNINRAGRYRGASGEWSGSQARDQEQDNGQTSQGSGAGSAENQTETGNRAQEKHNTKAESAGLNVP
ncbi:unnamed protein product, partial [Staurois parvus]